MDASVAGVIVGVIAIIVAFVVLWLQAHIEHKRRQRETQEREQAIIWAVKDEIEANTRICLENLLVIETSRQAMTERKIEIAPLLALRSNFVALIWSGLPLVLARDKSIVALFSEVAAAIERFNAFIESREQFRFGGNFDMDILAGIAEYDATAGKLADKIVRLSSQLQERMLSLEKTST